MSVCQSECPCNCSYSFTRWQHFNAAITICCFVAQRLDAYHTLLLCQAACLYNAIWGLVQIRYADLDFDFPRYVRLWLEQYRTWKDRFLSLEMP